jgi:putative transposase
MPKMPRYKKSGSKSMAILTNQICVIKEDKYLKFPKTKNKLNIAKIGVNNLKEVRIKPHFVGFTIDIVSETPIEGEIKFVESEKLLTKYKDNATIPERALSIDIGLSNLCAVVNNFGERPFLINGNPIKSKNQYYNKLMAKYRSEAKLCNDLNWTLRMERLTRKRNNQIKDYMHKTTTYIAQYAKSHEVKIVVIGHNKLQKQNINIGKANNQNFVSIPTIMLIKQLQYKLNRLGIELIVVEESYTSKASFENLDFLPTYGVDDELANFSGARIQRGLYQSDGKNPINADLNGAANIFRKAFPNVIKWDRGIVDMPIVVKI